MAGETPITVVGNLTSDPDLRFTQQGKPVASFTVASTPRTFDRNTNEWRDGEPLFLRVNAWDKLAEHVSASLVKGQRVIVQGSLVQRSYEDKQGQKRSSYEIQAEDIGPSLKFGSTVYTKGGLSREKALGNQPAPQQADWGQSAGAPF